MKKYMTIADLCKRGLWIAGLAFMGLTAEAQTYEQYVKNGGAFSNDGASWATAKNNVQEALNKCKDALDGGAYSDAVVYVAAGTYKPTEATEGNTAQYQAFKIYAGVTVKGGYDKDGNEDATQKPVFDGSLDARLTTKFFWNANKQRFDTEFPNNSYHVVTFATNGFGADGHAKALDKPAALENIIIEHGRAFSNDAETAHLHYAYGGGVYMVEGATLRNCEVRYCVASRDGGAVYMDGGGTIEQCDIHDNQALGLGVKYGMGGGVAASNGGTLARTYIYNNVGRMGGGLALDGNAAALASLVANNTSTTEAGGVYVKGNGTLNSMSIYRNRCNGSGARIEGVVTGRSAGVYCAEGGKVYNSAIWGNSIGNTVGETLGDMQFYAFSKGTNQTTLVNVALSNSDRINWSFASTSGLVPLASAATDINLTKVTATTGVLFGTDIKTAIDAKPQEGSLLIGQGLQNVTPTVSVDLVGEDVSPVCDLGAVMASVNPNIEGASINGAYVLFVDPNASSNPVVTGAGNYGASWANPLSNLNDALSHMRVRSGNLIIYVKEGTIIPANSESASLRGATLSMVSGCTVEGGYPAELTGTNLEENNGGTLKRNPLAYPTIVTGSIGSSDYANNIAHLVTFNGVTGAVLDGFQLRYGNATGDGNQNGAGIYARGGSGNKVLNTVVAGCTAAQGAGLYVGNGGQMEVVNTIFRNNAVSGTIDSNSKAAIVAAGGNSTLKLTHCDVIGNVGNGLYETGSTVTVEYSVFYANLNKALENSNNWVQSDAKLCAPIIKDGGTLSVTQSLFDSQWANQTDKLVSQSNTALSAGVAVSMCVLDCDPNNVAAYPQFKDATRNVGISLEGDITFYGNAADYTPSNMNPMTNGAAASSLGVDMIGTARTYGGAADIGAMENFQTQPEAGAVMYVREYFRPDGSVDTDHTTTSMDYNDGSSWARAINGNAPYQPYTLVQGDPIYDYSHPHEREKSRTETFLGFRISYNGNYLKVNGNSIGTTRTPEDATLWYIDNNTTNAVPTNDNTHQLYVVGTNKNYLWISTNKSSVNVSAQDPSNGGFLGFIGGTKYSRDFYLGVSNNGVTIRTNSRYLYLNSSIEVVSSTSSCNWTFDPQVKVDIEYETYYDIIGYGPDKKVFSGAETLGLQYAVDQVNRNLGLIESTKKVDYKYSGGATANITLTYRNLPAGKEDGQVWVGAGIYTDPNGYFFRDHVKVYGGFPAVGNPGMEERHPQLSTGIAMSEENKAANLRVEDYETIIQTKSTKGQYALSTAAATDLNGKTFMMSDADSRNLSFYFKKEGSSQDVKIGNLDDLTKDATNNYYFYKFTKVNGTTDVYSIQVVNGANTAYSAWNGAGNYLNMQPGGNIIFCLGENQDGSNLGRWRVTYDSSNGYTIQNVGRVERGQSSYLSPVSANPIEGKVYVNLFTALDNTAVGVNTLSQPRECQVTISDDSNTPQSHVYYEGAEWDGFTISNGYKRGVTGSGSGRRWSGAGAAMYENCILRNCVVRDNKIGGNTSTRGRGAGIYCDGSSVINCFVLDNESACGQENFGGGIYMIDGWLYNSVIAGNAITYNTSGNRGAGIFIESAKFFNNTIVNNTGGSAIGVYTASKASSDLTVYNTIVIAGDGQNLLWRASDATPTVFDNCYLKANVNDAAIANARTNASSVVCVRDNATDYTGDNRVRENMIYLNTNLADRNPFVLPYSEAIANHDYHIEVKADEGTNRISCVNAGTEDIKARDNSGSGTPQPISLPENDMDYTDRIQDCRVDIGAYEFNGASLITPTVANGVATYYVSENGRTSTAATSPETAACWQKIQRVLDAAGRYKYAHPTTQVIVKLAGEEKVGDKTMKDLYDDPERGEKKGGMFAFKYSPRNTTNLNSNEDDMRNYSLMIPRGVEVWGGYSVNNNTDKTKAATYTEFASDTTNVYGRSITKHPTVLDGRYESSDKTQYVYAYHTLTFTDKVFDANHKPYLFADATQVENAGNSTYSNQVDGFLSLATKTQDRAVVDGLFITGGRANKPEDNVVGSTITKSYGGAGVLTDFAHIRNCIVEDNKALNGGGAFLLQSGSLISGTLLKKNEAHNGGALYFGESGDNPDYNRMACVITTTIVDNTASGQGGGAWFKNNARFNSTVLWGNHCNNQKNIYGESPEYSDAKFAYYYTAVENMRVPGINNLNVSSVDDQGVRFSDHIYYGLDIYSALVNTGTLRTAYGDLRTSDKVAEYDFMNRRRQNDDYEYITIGARAQFRPDYTGLITRLYVDPNQSADLSYSQELAVRYFESLKQQTSPTYSQRGSSNGFPMHSLQEAIDYINLKRGNGQATIDTEFQIILADGEYWPSHGTDAYDPTNFTFIIPDNVKIVGGVVNTLRSNGDEDGLFLGQPSASITDSKVAELSLDRLIELRETLRTFDENQNNVIEPWEFAKVSYISGNVVNSEQDGTNSKYVITIDATTNKGILFNGVVVGDGKAGTKDSQNENGGAIKIESETVPVTVNQCQFLDNKADKGGAIENHSTLNVYNSFFAKNTSVHGGGAIYSDGKLFVTNTLFANNETAGDGGAIYSGSNGTLRLTNCDVVMNKAADWPAIYSNGTAKDQVLNTVFWGNEAEGANKQIIPKAANSVRFSAYESGLGPEATITNDERDKAATISNNLVSLSGLTQNSNLIISSVNDDLDGPNFGNPSAKAGVEGYTPDVDFMPYRENRLVDAGWGWVEQNAAGTAYGDGKGGAYAAVHDSDPTQLAIGVEDYILPTMNRISLNPTPGAGTKAFIDLGVYELVKVPLHIAGICVDELWVSTEEKRDNGVADGSSWMQPTTNVQAAINTLLSSRCGHHKVLHIMEGEYNPVDYDGIMAYVINTGKLNQNANIDGYANHLSGEDIELDGKVYKFGAPNGEAFPGVASLTIIGGYSKNISEYVDVEEERSGETITDVRQGVRDGEQYPTLLTSKFTNTEHVIDISDARQWYGYGDIAAIPAYNINIPHLKLDDKSEPTVVPIVIEGIMVKNALANGEGLAVNYAPASYQKDKDGNIFYVPADQISDGKTYYTIPAIVNGIKMPKLTISHDILYGSGSNTNSSALYIGQGGGQSLVLNSLFHSNAGNSIDAYDTKIVNSTIALNGGKVVLRDSDPANKVNSIFGSLLWRNASGEYEGVSDLHWNAISGGSDDANNNTSLGNENSDIVTGPNFINPENSNVDKRNFHLQASQKTLNIIENGLYDAALGANKTDGFDWFHAKLIHPYVAQDLAFVSRYLPSAVERGAYEYQQDGSRVLYYKPGGENKRDNDGLSWDKAFGQGNLQGAINLAALYNVSHPGEQAYVYAKTGDTHETITLVKGVSVIGGVSSTFNENVENDEDGTGKKVISDEQAEAYATIVTQTRPGVAAPGSNSTTVVDGIKATGTFNEPAIVDGLEVKGDLVIKPTEVGEDKEHGTKGAIVIRNTIIDAPEGATSQRLEVDNALIYNVLLRNNLVDLTLGDNAYAAHVTSNKDFTGNNVSERTYYNNMKYTGGAYKWNAYPNINYQLDETDDARIDQADAYNKNKNVTYPNMPANLQAYINVDIDRDILGNPRLLGDKTDFGCYEMWRITSDEDIHANYESERIYNRNDQSALTTASKVWRNFPHVGSDVYIMGDANFILDETLIGLNNRDSRVEDYNMKPGFLLVKEGGSLYGQGNVVSASYVASEQTLRAEGNLVALPYRHNYNGIVGREEGNYSGDNGKEMAKYNGDERAAWKYNSNWFAATDSECWDEADADEEIPAFEGVYFLGSETDAPHRFTSKGKEFTDYLYTENGASKPVILTQHNNLMRGNTPIADGQLTAKEDMGWNLFGIPYLVSHYKPYEKPSAEANYYMMQLPKELWLFYNGTIAPDGNSAMLNGAGFYQVNSWDRTTWHQASTDTPRLWHGEGFFAQTATIRDSEQIVFQFPRYEGPASPAPQTRAGLEGNTRFYVVEDFEPEPEENNIYFDLNGRRVQNPQAGRIYIVNGKKVIM